MRNTAAALLVLASLVCGCPPHAARAATGEQGLEPRITTFSPASGHSGTLVIISGSNLFSVTSISFSDGVSAPVYGSLDDGTAVQTEVPLGAVSGPVQVVAASGTAISPEAFEVRTGGPVVESFSPTSGPVRTSVSFVGSGLVGVKGVRFNGVDAAFYSLAGLSADVPGGATTGPITVTTEQGSFTTTNVFTVTTPAKPGPPIIAEFTPQSGEPHTMINMHGTNLVNIRSVKLNGLDVEFTQMVADWLAFEVPLEATTGPITIVTDSGSYTTVDSFDVLPIPPQVIKDFSPKSGFAGTWVSINGLTSRATAVRFSGVEAEFIRMGLTILSAKVPYAPSGPITVVTEGGVAVSSELFTVLGGPEPPRILGFSPTQALPGTRVTIQGAGLEGVRAIHFNGTEAEFVGDRDLLEAVVPAFATSGPITVLTRFGPASSAEPIHIFNSGELGLFGGPSVDPVILGNRLTFSIAVTNLTAQALTGITLTNTFASGGGPSEGVVGWLDGTPSFTNVTSADIEIIRVTMTQGTGVVTNGAVVCVFGDLAPSQAVSVDIEVEPHAPDFLHLLSVATATSAQETSRSVYSGLLTSTLVSGSVQLWIRESGNGQVEIAWPVMEPPLILQSAEEPVRTANWRDVPESVTVADRCYVRVPAHSGRRFFRLIERGAPSDFNPTMFR